MMNIANSEDCPICGHKDVYANRYENINTGESVWICKDCDEWDTLVREAIKEGNEKLETIRYVLGGKLND